MLATTILTFFVIRFAWGYNLALCIAVTGFFVFIDAAFFASSLLKVHEGGWFPLVLAAIVFTVITTWHRGREIASASQSKSGVPLATFLESLARNPPHRVRTPSSWLNMRTPSRDAVTELRLQQGSARACHLSDHSHSQRPWVPVSERIAIEPLGGACTACWSISASWTDPTSRPRWSCARNADLRWIRRAHGSC
jgi:KUP system potassium uptake protein